MQEKATRDSKREQLSLVPASAPSHRFIHFPPPMFGWVLIADAQRDFFSPARRSPSQQRSRDF